MTSETTGGYAGESSGGEETGKGLKEWWNKFKSSGKGAGAASTPGLAATRSRSRERTYQSTTATTSTAPTEGRPVFSMPLSEAITYASITISTPGPDGTFYVWGVVPTVVARCGRYLKENATEVEGTFRVSGSSKRMKEIQAIFDRPPKYGKYINWSEVPHTSHDVATIFRRFLTQMPDSVIPDSFYHEFRDTYTDDPTKEKATVESYSNLIKRLPVPNKYLLLYVLDLLSVFEKKSDKNLMTATNLAVIFQPGILSHPDHRMLPSEHPLSQKVLEFLVTHVDDFSPLLESRLKENPYRRTSKGKSSSSSTSPRPHHTSTNNLPPPPLTPTTSSSSSSSSNANPPPSSSSRRQQPAPAPSSSSSHHHHQQQQPSGRPSTPPRSTRLSDTMAASESDDDFPGGVVIRMGDPARTQERLLSRSKSTSATSKPGGGRGPSSSRSVSGGGGVGTSSPGHSSLRAEDGNGGSTGRGTPTTMGTGAGAGAGASVRRRSTAPSNRRLEGGGVSGGGGGGRRKKIVEEEKKREELALTAGGKKSVFGAA
ncbi:Rho GTPase activation protein [Mrakia frigida]|uniref:Rho GTPase activation protein n=1 Tax=Mrakia frigida TaxID=29902 RepID=UPI003FCC16B2